MLKSVSKRLYAFSLSDLCTLLTFLFAYACAVLQMSEIGICLLVLFASLLCLFTNDVVPVILPLLLIYCLSFLCPSSAWLAWLGIPGGAALVFLMLKNWRTMRPGRGFPGIVATAVAVLLGGIGSITAAEYFSPSAVFIVLGLSVMLIAFYLLLRGSLMQKRQYDTADHIARTMYLCAVFVSFLILQIFLTHPELLEEGLDGLVERLEQLIDWRNGASNLVIICLPFVFYYARRHSVWHLLSACLMYALVAFAGSRAAILLGALFLLIGMLYYAYGRPWLMGGMLLAIALFGAALVLWREPIVYFIEEVLCFRLDRDYHDESRYKLFVRGIEDFLHAPIFGRGLGYQGNEDVYPLLANTNPDAARWRVHWYHSLIPQIIGSMGTVGILAYGYQFLLRLREIFTARRTAFVGALTFAYFGMLAYSFLDPGIFSPMPFAVLTVMVAALLEVQPRRTEN